MGWWWRGFVEQGRKRGGSQLHREVSGPRLACGGFANLAPVRRSRNIAVHMFPVTKKAGRIHKFDSGS